MTCVKKTAVKKGVSILQNKAERTKNRTVTHVIHFQKIPQIIIPTKQILAHFGHRKMQI